MEVVARFTPNPKDHFDAVRANLYSHPWVIAIFVIFFALIPWGAAFFSLYCIHYLNLPMDAAMAYKLAMIPFLIFGTFALIAWHQGKRLYANAPTLKGEHIYRFTDEQVVCSGPGFNNILDWNSITRYSRTAAGYMLFIGPRPVIFVPRRALDGEKTVQTFELLLAAHV